METGNNINASWVPAGMLNNILVVLTGTQVNAGTTLGGKEYVDFKINLA